MGMPPQVAVYQLYLEGIPLFRQLISHQTYNYKFTVGAKAAWEAGY